MSLTVEINLIQFAAVAYALFKKFAKNNVVNAMKFRNFQRNKLTYYLTKMPNECVEMR